MAALLACCSGAATAGVDDVWNASPATTDTQWAQANAAPVNPVNSGSGSDGKWISGQPNGVNTYGSTIWVNVKYSSTAWGSSQVFVDGQQVCESTTGSGQTWWHIHTCIVPVPSGSSWSSDGHGTQVVRLYIPK